MAVKITEELFISDNVQENQRFPDETIDPRIKASSAEWNLQMCTAFHNNFRKNGLNAFYNRRKDFEKWRRYARGDQSVDQYKKRLGVRKQYRESKTWRNIDWTILKIAPKFKRNMTAKIQKNMSNLKVQAIDPISVDKRLQMKASLQEYLINQEFYRVMQEMTGVSVDTPMPEGTPLPTRQEDVDIHMNMYYKDRLAMEMQEYLELTMEMVNWKNVSENIITDLLEVGLAGSRSYLDKYNNIQMRACIPERMGIWGAKRKDFRDAKAIWEYIDITEDEFMEYARQMGLTLKEARRYYKNARDTSLDTNIYNPYTWDYTLDYSRSEKQVAWIMDLRFTTHDTEVYQKRVTNAGNETVYRKPVEKRREDGMIVNDIPMVYECKWLVGTNLVWDFGPAVNIPRDTENLNNIQMGFTLYNTDDASFMSEMMPVFDAIQINWLQYQNHILRTKPPGIEIEMSAFEDINMGKGMEKMSPKDVITMAYDTGSIVWRRKDWSGRDNGWKPIAESPAWLPEGAVYHLNIIMQLINYLRDISGLNQLADGSTPDQYLSKKLGEIAAVSSIDNVHYLYHAFDHLYEGTGKTLLNLMRLQLENAEENNIIITALGYNTFRFLEMFREYRYIDFGLQVLNKPDDHQKAVLQRYVEVSLQAGEITPDEAYQIENEDNLYRAANMLEVRRKQRIQEQQEQKMLETQMLAEQQSQSALATSQAKQQEMQVEAFLDVEKEKMKSQLRIIEDREFTKHEIIKIKIEKGMEMSKDEMEQLNKLIISRENNQVDLEQTIIMSQAQKDMAVINEAKRESEQLMRQSQDRKRSQR